MDKLIFYLILVLTAEIISLVTGRNKRQISRIPQGMGIMCQPPGKRYVVYALGVVVFVTVMIFSVLFIMDGAPESARGMWGLCVAMAVLMLALTIFCGNVMARDCVYFNGAEFQIAKAFRKPRIVKWYEIQRVDGNFDDHVTLYLTDETKILTASISMVNYEQFCKVLKITCPNVVAGYYKEKSYDDSKKRILRWGSEYYVLAVMGILIFAMYLVMIAQAGSGEVLQEILESQPHGLFALLFAPVCGTVSLILLFVMCSTKIQYSEEKMILKYPLRKKRELLWRNIRKMELVRGEVRGVKVWKKLRIHADGAAYWVNLMYLSHGKDEFMTMLWKMVERYEISCEAH